MNELIIKKMVDYRDSATKSQKKLIDYLKNTDLEKVMYMSITELSDETKVGEATILRFARALGFKGYQDFKLELAKGFEITNSNELSNYAVTLANNMIDTLNLCKEKIDLDVIEETSKIILSSKRVCIFGSGDSGVAAKELYTRLLRLGITVSFEPDPHLQNILLSNYGEDDALILFSISGESVDSLDILKLAVQNNVKTVVITSYIKSPMAKLANIVIQSAKGESPINGGSLQVKITQFYIVYVLLSEIIKTDTEKYQKEIERTSLIASRKLI